MHFKLIHVTLINSLNAFLLKNRFPSTPAVTQCIVLENPLQIADSCFTFQVKPSFRELFFARTVLHVTLFFSPIPNHDPSWSEKFVLFFSFPASIQTVTHRIASDADDSTRDDV